MDVHDSRAYAEPQSIGNGLLLCASVFLHSFSLIQEATAKG